MKKKLRVIFSGTVQGVGFRFTAERLAKDFDVAGFVRNLSDSRVELEAEGEDSDLRHFLAAIQTSHLAGYIQNADTEWLEFSGAFSGFSIKR